MTYGRRARAGVTAMRSSARCSMKCGALACRSSTSTATKTTNPRAASSSVGTASSKSPSRFRAAHSGGGATASTSSSPNESARRLHGRRNRRRSARDPVHARAARALRRGGSIDRSGAARRGWQATPDLSDVLVDDGSLPAFAERLRAARFDAAIVTWATPRSAALPFAAGIPLRVGQSRRSYSLLFNRRVTVRSELGDHTTHWTQILLDYARALNCDDPAGMPVFVDVSAGDAATTLRELRRPGFRASTRCCTRRAASRRRASAGHRNRLGGTLRVRGCAKISTFRSS